jgi:hypothetical protein
MAPMFGWFSWSDLISTPALSSAILVGAGLAMNWRSLHIAGEHAHHVRIWGALSVAVFLFAWVSGAIQNHSSLVTINAAENRADGSQKKLEEISSGISKIEQLVVPTGKPTPNEVLAAAAAKIIDQDKRIGELETLSADREIPQDVRDKIVALLRDAGPHSQGSSVLNECLGF